MMFSTLTGKFGKDSARSEEYPIHSLLHPNGSGGCTTFRIRLKQSGARVGLFVKPPEPFRCSPERPTGRTIAALTRLIVARHPNPSGAHSNPWGNARARDLKLHEYIMKRLGR